MADRGVKNLILPSRSGPSSQAAKEVVSELSQRGIRLLTPKCDVSSPSSLAMVLEECAYAMPVIKGCINATMVLQVCICE